MRDATNNSRPEKPPGAGSSSIDLIDVDLFFQALALKPGISVVDLGKRTGGLFHPDRKDHRQRGPSLRRRSLEGMRRVFAVGDQAPGDCQHRAHPGGHEQAAALRGESIDACLMATILHDLKDNQSHDAALYRR